MKRRLVLRLVLATLATVLLFEVGARFLLFSDSAAGIEGIESLRDARRLAHPNTESLYWQLHAEWEGQLRGIPSDFDERLGWVGSLVTPGTYDHLDADSVGTRRPVLLYGDSFSRCTTLEGRCFEDLLEASDLGATHRLLNYGVTGYGLDQTTLMLESTIERWVDRAPAVVVGVFVDDDLDRCALDFRSYPKPRMDSNGEFAPLEYEPPSVPWATSYGVRLLIHGAALRSSAVHDVLCPEPRIAARNRERLVRVVERLAGVLERFGGEAFVVIFNGRRSIDDPAVTEWRESFLREQLDARGIPWVTARGPLLAHARQSGRRTADYFQEDGHLNALGNHAAHRAILDGLAGRFGDLGEHAFTATELAGPPLTPDNIAEVVLGGPQCVARYEQNDRPPFTGADERSRLVFRQVGATPTTLSYDLEGRIASFAAVAKFIPLGKLGPGEGSMGLVITADDEVVFDEVLRRGDPPREIDAEVAGRETLTLRIDGAGDGRRGDFLMLASPRFR